MPYKKPTWAEQVRHYETMLDRATGKYTAVNPERTLAAWQRRTIKAREALMEAKERYQDELANLRETYTEKVYAEKRKPFDTDYENLKKQAESNAKADLQQVLEGKRKQYDKANDAPSQADIRLLQALQMRTTLTMAEIAAVSGKFGGNLQSLRVLRDIAKKHGISFPDVGDPERFDRMIEEAEAYSLEQLQYLDTDKSEMTYVARAFYYHPGAGVDRNYYTILDTQGFSAEEMTDVSSLSAASAATTSSAAPTADKGESAEYWSEVTLNGRMELGTIARQFRVTESAIREANPDKDFSNWSRLKSIYVPSTQFSFSPDPNHAHVQPQDARAVRRPTPQPLTPLGPNGEEPGDMVQVVAADTAEPEPERKTDKDVIAAFADAVKRGGDNNAARST